MCICDKGTDFLVFVGMGIVFPLDFWVFFPIAATKGNSDNLEKNVNNHEGGGFPKFGIRKTSLSEISEQATFTQEDHVSALSA